MNNVRSARAGIAATLRLPANRWVQLIFVTASAQAVVQALGFLSGLFVIRMLTTEEYAVYTLANTMLSAMTMLADGGVTTGVMAQSGKIWGDKQQLGAVISTGMQLRRQFAALCLLIGIPLVFSMFHRHNVSWLMSCLVVLALIPAFLTSLTGTLLEVGPKLDQDVHGLQKNQLLGNTLRFALLGVSVTAFPFAAIAIACGSVAQLWNNWRLKKMSSQYWDPTLVVDPAVREEILVVVRRIMPGTIYYCLSGQITIWLISFFGTTEGIAQVGALGRLAMIFNLPVLVFSTIAVPHFARAREALTAKFLQIQFYLCVVVVAAVGAIWFFPEQILWILGAKYSGLSKELMLMAIASGISVIGGASYSLCSHRGYVMRPSITIPVSIVAQGLLVYGVGCTSVSEILTISIGQAVVQCALWTLYFFFVVAAKKD